MNVDIFDLGGELSYSGIPVFRCWMLILSAGNLIPVLPWTPVLQLGFIA